jgi:hypothetical protein
LGEGQGGVVPRRQPERKVEKDVFFKKKKQKTFDPFGFGFGFGFC